MVSLEDAVIARITREGKSFEIVVDPEKAMEFKKGKELPMETILAVPGVFSDSKKGERAPENELHTSFGTTNPEEIAAKIIREGEIQLTTEQRRKLLEEKRLQVASMISKQGVDPKTHTPHPQARILNAMKEAKVSIDPFRPARDQVNSVLEKIRAVIPISMESVVLAIRIPMEFAGKASSALRESLKIEKEEWRTDSWLATAEIPAGMQGEILDKVNNLTHGKAEVKVIKRGEAGEKI